MIRKGILKSYDSSTHRATVQIIGSLTSWLTIPTSHAIAAEDMVAGRSVAVLTPDPWKPSDSVVIALWEDSVAPSIPATCTGANQTIYVDSAATGAGDGSSWTDASTSIQAAWDSLPDIVAHDIIIRVRKGSTPYRETVTCSKKYVIATVTIEGEFYLNGDCEAHAFGVGEIVDTGAFGDALVGDHVYMYKLGANDRITDYSICTVDDISNAPNRIGTDEGGKAFNTTTWHYVIVRTHISGSDDGTDGGTARDYCVEVVSVDNVNIKGFYMDFSDKNIIPFTNSRYSSVYYCICEEADNCIASMTQSGLEVRYTYVYGHAYALVAYTLGYIDARYCVMGCDHGSNACVLAGRSSGMVFAYSHVFAGALGVSSEDESWCYPSSVVITAGVTVGLNANLNSSIRKANITNNAGTPEQTASGGIIA